MTATCTFCGVVFEFWHGQGPRRLYCSPRCRYAARDAKRFLPIGSTVTAVCANCGQAFAYVSTTKRRKFCLDCRPRKEALK